MESARARSRSYFVINCLRSSDPSHRPEDSSPGAVSQGQTTARLAACQGGRGNSFWLPVGVDDIDRFDHANLAQLEPLVDLLVEPVPTVPPFDPLSRATRNRPSYSAPETPVAIEFSRDDPG